MEGVGLGTEIKAKYFLKTWNIIWRKGWDSRIGGGEVEA